MLKSVYNFVPAPNEDAVFKPEWAKQVSHDIPFSDGESGEIELIITAQTPIFIRNGHSREVIDNEFSHRMINGKKEYFIPGSSLKGMIRNVVEMMSFSRMKTQNDLFSFRDLNHASYKNEVAQNKKLKTGWLSHNGEKWTIQECEVGRIPIRNIERKYHVSFKDCSAAEKYKLVATDVALKFQHERELGMTTNRGSFIKTGDLYSFNPNGIFKGELVFFGHIEGKEYEYIFTEGFGIDFNVSNELMQKFKEIDAKLKGSQWQYFQENNISKIPVFFETDFNDNVLHFGFSRLYKLPNTKHLNELQPLKSYYGRKREYQMDLAETIFGTVADDEKDHGTNRNSQTLKGRVMISHAKVEKLGEGKIEDVPVVLASPKASYYPFYLQDNKTYLNKGAVLKGFKKYPVHNKVKPSKRNEENDDIESTIKPLPKETSFIAKVRFHNLRKEEIGALLSAITFHGNEENLFHSIGSGKPLGYGKIKVRVTKTKFLKKEVKNYLADFETLMKLKHPNWIKSDTIRELFAMANPPSDDHLLVYPELELPNTIAKDANEFNNYKKTGESLKPYSQRNAFGKITSIAEEQAEKEAQQQKEREEQEKQKKEAITLLAFNNAIEKNSKESLLEFLSKYPRSKEDYIIEVKGKLANIRKEERKNDAEKSQKEPFNFDKFDFPSIQNKVKPRFKNKAFKCSDDQKAEISEAIKISFTLGNNKNKFHKKGKAVSFSKFPWSADISNWLGKEQAQKLYNEITS